MRTSSTTFACCVLALACACGKQASGHAPALAEARLEGTWELSLRLERPMSLARLPTALPFTVTGTVTMTTNRSPEVSFPSIRDPTALGVYQLPLDSLGLARWDAQDVPTVAASARRNSGDTLDGRKDSVLVVLNPGQPNRVVELKGVFVGTEIRGIWTAASPLGGGGTFTLRQRRRY